MLYDAADGGGIKVKIEEQNFSDAFKHAKSVLVSA
jgi:hypothetical protein